MSIFDHYKARYESIQQEEMSLQEYLDLCKEDPIAYANASERMLQAIGEPELVDTSLEPRLSRIFSNKVIKRYPAFHEFYGMEEAIEAIVSYFRHAAQGLEEKKQILYLLGPVGGGKSSLAERPKALMQHIPFYAIKALFLLLMALPVPLISWAAQSVINLHQCQNVLKTLMF